MRLSTQGRAGLLLQRERVARSRGGAPRGQARPLISRLVPDRFATPLALLSAAERHRDERAGVLDAFESGRSGWWSAVTRFAAIVRGSMPKQSAVRPLPALHRGWADCPRTAPAYRGRRPAECASSISGSGPPRTPRPGQRDR